jgi:hypothetical protein
MMHFDLLLVLQQAHMENNRMGIIAFGGRIRGFWARARS